MLKVVEEDRENLTKRNEEMAFAAALYGAVTSLGIAVYNFIIAEKLHSTIIYVGTCKSIIFYVYIYIDNTIMICC